MKKKSYLEEAKRVFQIEAGAIQRLADRLSPTFDQAVEWIAECKGRIVVTGMGKPGIIGRKISATLASTGIPSVSLHPAEAIHGDLGMVAPDDVVLALSNSGETEEMTRLLPLLKKIGVKLIVLTGNTKSTLASHSDLILDVSVEKEACSVGMVPTASTTAMLAMGDALTVALFQRRGFQLKDYAFYHPGGELGKKLLLKVEDIMRSGDQCAIVQEDTQVKDVLLAITEARAGSASVVDSAGSLIGIFTDGDLRRCIEKTPHMIDKGVSSFMTHHPVTVTPDHLATEALRIIKEKKVDEVPVVDQKGRPVGLVDEKDLLGLS